MELFPEILDYVPDTREEIGRVVTGVVAVLSMNAQMGEAAGTMVWAKLVEGREKRTKPVVSSVGLRQDSVKSSSNFVE
ncbi:MAG: hypothetical protein HYV39_03035 [Candidatus Levybacteria bacterium]|nr:hypothetical protein [Candidatus Levybacteria bacterium]